MINTFAHCHCKVVVVYFCLRVSRTLGRSEAPEHTHLPAPFTESLSHLDRSRLVGRTYNKHLLDNALNPSKYRFLPHLQIVRACDEHYCDVYRNLFHRASRLRVVSLNPSH